MTKKATKPQPKASQSAKSPKAVPDKRPKAPLPEARPVSRASEQEIVVTEPARCIRPSCRSTATTQIAPTHVTEVNTTVRGLPVTHINRTQMQCQTCSQRFIHVQHLNYPTK